MPIRVWGKADKNEVISVALNGSVQTAKTGKDGIWRVELPAMKAGGPYDMQIESVTIFARISSSEMFGFVADNRIWSSV